MLSEPSTPPQRSERHTRSANYAGRSDSPEYDQYGQPCTPPRRRRYRGSDASLPSWVKRNVVQEAAKIEMGWKTKDAPDNARSAEDSPSGAAVSSPPQCAQDLDDEAETPPGSCQCTIHGESHERQYGLPADTVRNLRRDFAALRKASTKRAVPDGTIARPVVEFPYDAGASTPPNEMECLQWSWGGKFCDIQADMKTKMPTCGTDVRGWLEYTEDQKPIGWFWVPADFSTFINMHVTYVGMWNQTRGTTLNVRCDPNTIYEKEKKTEFSYWLISFPNMVWPYRHSENKPYCPRDFEPNEGEYDLECVVLDVPYHYVVVNTGRILTRMYGTGEIDFERDFPKLSGSERFPIRDVHSMYVAWTRATPDKAWYAGEDWHPPETSVSADAGNIESHSVYHRQVRSTTRRANAAESLAPSDSPSCSGLADAGSMERAEDEDEDAPFVDVEEEEYSDEEFFEGVKHWASDVWGKTQLNSTHNVRRPPD